MAYTKRNFIKEQLLTAEDLNAMDDQIAKNEKTAEEAKTAASDAKTAASDAKTVASDAKTAASDAKTAAGNALDAIEKAFVDRGELTSENNIDDVDEPGLYRWYDSSAPSGNPTRGGALMIVIRSGAQNLVTQTVTSMYQNEKTKKRTKYPGGWSDWIDLLEDDSEVMIYRKWLLADDDIDTLNQCGIYGYNAHIAPSNAPFTAETIDTSDTIIVCVYAAGSNSTLQIASGYRQLKFRVKKGSWITVGQHYDLVQETGDRTDAVMSQDAVTRAVKNATGGGGTSRSQTRMMYNASYTTGVAQNYDANNVGNYKDYRTNDTSLKVQSVLGESPSSDFAIVIAPGTAFIKGLVYGTTANSMIGIKTSESENIVAVGIRADTTAGTISLFWRENCIRESYSLKHPLSDGTYQNLPVRSGGTYDLILAVVTIPAGAVAGDSVSVEDCRFADDSSLFFQKPAQYIQPGAKFNQDMQEATFHRLYSMGILDDADPDRVTEHLGNINETASKTYESFKITISGDNMIKIGAGRVIFDGTVIDVPGFTRGFTFGEYKSWIYGIAYNPTRKELRQYNIEDVSGPFSDGSYLGYDKTYDDSRRLYPIMRTDELGHYGSDWCELLLVHVEIPESAAAITSDMVTDLREDSRVCGYAKSAIQNMYGTQKRPTYNGNDLALMKDVPSSTEVLTITYKDGTTGTLEVYRK